MHELKESAFAQPSLIPTWQISLDAIIDVRSMLLLFTILVNMLRIFIDQCPNILTVVTCNHNWLYLDPMI